MSESSRKFFTLNLSESRLFSSQLRKRKNRINEDVEQGIADPNFFSRYLSRPDDYEQMTLIEMAKKHYWARRKWCKHRVEPVVRILPDFIGKKIIPDTDLYESFCRQQVLLNSRYRSFEEAKRDLPTWSGRYAELIRPTENPSVDLGIVEEEFEDKTHPEEEWLDEWMQASAMAPNFRALEATDLGLRDIDRNHSWSRGLLDNPTIHEKIGFVNTLRQVVQDTHDSGSSTSLPTLSRQQQAAHDLVLDSLRSNSTIRLIISGGAGTGKSTLINAIVRSTRELFSNENSVRIMAPTGVAAFNIGGSTIHHELGITADKSQSYKKLEVERCRQMQVDFKNTKLIIIDEYSMIGRKILAYIDLRLRDIFGTKESFGNISIVLVGDMRQIPPIFDTPLYAEGGRELQLTGNHSYSKFKQFVRLEQVFRQSGVEELEYREALSRLSDGKSTVADWNLFATRSYTTLSVEEIHSFRHALRLFPSKDEAASYNEERLRELGFPVARILLVNNCLTAEGASSDDAKGLQNILLLSKQARVMLRKNYSTQFGLVNGSTGTVKDIIYKEGDESPGNIPIAVLNSTNISVQGCMKNPLWFLSFLSQQTGYHLPACHASGFNYHLSCVGQ
ncbi:hypothetical protein MKW98_026217 [Papaver atlanticum]|uniref:ATP-dependent DNA helicase n=1 Tax=Papaver atlanticum TaxID=357466 RepID=A0AAD4T370_9MAGN|nr:hypothetical protein MKW98_026217 [Papaver atlanticum]